MTTTTTVNIEREYLTEKYEPFDNQRLIDALSLTSTVAGASALKFEALKDGYEEAAVIAFNAGDSAGGATLLKAADAFAIASGAWRNWQNT